MAIIFLSFFALLIMIQRFSIIIFFLFSINLLHSQTAGIQLQAGANLSYVFNSIAKYKTGISDIDRTVVGITINDVPLGIYTEWTLEINFADADASNNIKGGIYNLPFSAVEISTSLVNCVGCNTPGVLPVPYPLTDIPTIIIQGGDGPGGGDDVPPNYISAIDKILISYFIGTNPGNRLLGSPADFYTEDIVLTLTMQ